MDNRDMTTIERFVALHRQQVGLDSQTYTTAEAERPHRLESHRSRKGRSRKAWIAMLGYSAAVFFFGLTTGYVARDYPQAASSSALYAQGLPAPLRIDYDLRNR